MFVFVFVFYFLIICTEVFLCCFRTWVARISGALGSLGMYTRHT